MNPLPFWQENESEDRIGVRENLHCQAYLRYWDALLEANPGLVIDSCASGGRRNDLETMRRSVPLWKTDFIHADLTRMHAFHHSLFQWLPYFGMQISQYQPESNDYIYYSSYCAFLIIDMDVRDEKIDLKAVRKYVDMWREINHCILGDFIPLTPYSRDSREWIAWQFNSPESNDGIVQVFIREGSIYSSARFKLAELDSDDYLVYRIINGGKENPVRVNGTELCEKGIEITAAATPSAVMYYYKKVL